MSLCQQGDEVGTRCSHQAAPRAPLHVPGHAVKAQCGLPQLCPLSQHCGMPEGSRGASEGARGEHGPRHVAVTVPAHSSGTMRPWVEPPGLLTPTGRAPGMQRVHGTSARLGLRPSPSLLPITASPLLLSPPLRPQRLCLDLRKNIKGCLLGDVLWREAQPSWPWGGRALGLRC